MQFPVFYYSDWQLTFGAKWETESSTGILNNNFSNSDHVDYATGEWGITTQVSYFSNLVTAYVCVFAKLYLPICFSIQAREFSISFDVYPITNTIWPGLNTKDLYFGFLKSSAMLKLV